MSSSDRKELNRIADHLSPGRLKLILDMARAVEGDIPQSLDSSSDICTPKFSEYFSNLIRLHHATAPASQRFKEKTFEHGFAASLRATGRRARVTDRTNHPGEDVVADGERFSLKSETGGKVKRNFIKITKFMEASWIRSLSTRADCARVAGCKVLEHLARYDRVFVLKVLPLDLDSLTYQLWEIPHALLSQVGDLSAKDYAEPLESGRSSANVPDGLGGVAFKVVLDAGEENKVVMERVRADLCRMHASWDIRTLVSEDDAEDADRRLF